MYGVGRILFNVGFQGCEVYNLCRVSVPGIIVDLLSYIPASLGKPRYAFMHKYSVGGSQLGVVRFKGIRIINSRDKTKAS
jgi:hypothetical protein